MHPLWDDLSELKWLLIDHYPSLDHVIVKRLLAEQGRQQVQLEPLPLR